MTLVKFPVLSLASEGVDLCEFGHSGNHLAHNHSLFLSPTEEMEETDYFLCSELLFLGVLDEALVCLLGLQLPY